MPLRNDLDACLRRLKSAIISVNLSSADATKAWTDTQAAYEAAAGKQLHRSQTRSQQQQPEHQSITPLFEDWVQDAVKSDLPGLHRVARYAYEDLYHRLPHDKKVLVDNVTKRFDLDAFPCIFFAFGPSIVANSRQALESAVRIKKKRPTITLSELVSALREARINRAANSWRGSVVDATRFVLQDFKEAERVLLAASPSTVDNKIQGEQNKEGQEETGGSEVVTGLSRAEANTKKLLQNPPGRIESTEVVQAGSSQPQEDPPRSQASYLSPHAKPEQLEEEKTPRLEALHECNTSRFEDGDDSIALTEQAQPITPERGRSAVAGDPFEPSPLASNSYAPDSVGLTRPNSRRFTPASSPELTSATEGRIFALSELGSPRVHTKSPLDYLTRSQGVNLQPELPFLRGDDSYTFEGPYCHSSGSIVSDEHVTMGQLSTPQQWRCSWNTDDKATLDRQTLSYKDITTLDDSEQLNDEVLQALLTLLVNQNNSSEVFLHNTFFYEKLLSRDGLQRTMRWTKKIQLEKLRYIVIPIHRPNHWVVAILVVSETQTSTKEAPPGKSAIIITIDSLDCKGTSENEEIFLRLRNYLTTLIYNLDSDAVEWKHARGFARQSNSYDCGIYVLLAVEEFLQRPAAFVTRFCDTSEAPDSAIFDSLEGRHRFQELIIELKRKNDESPKKVDIIEDLAENETRLPFLMRLDMTSAMKAFGSTQDIENCKDYLVYSDQWNLILAAEAGTDFSALAKYESQQPSNNRSSVPARGFHAMLEEKKLRDTEWDDISIRMNDLHNTLGEQLQSAQEIFTVLSGLVELVERQLKAWNSRFQQDITKLASDNIALADSVAAKMQMLERHAKILLCMRNSSLLVNLLEGEKRTLESEMRRMEEVDDTELQRINMRKRRRFMNNHKT